MASRGRKLLFETPEALQEAIDKYFKECKDHKKTIEFEGKQAKIDDPKLPTIAGLAYAIGVNRHTVYNYETKDEFIHTIKRAREYIISLIEDKLVNDNGHKAGIIFYAKNYGYTDRQVLEHDIHGEAIKKIKDLFF